MEISIIDPLTKTSQEGLRGPLTKILSGGYSWVSSSRVSSSCPAGFCQTVIYDQESLIP